jgi:hypothetical protein
MIVGFSFGLWWALATLVALPFSFFASVRLLEAEAGLLTSMQSLLKLTRLGAEVDDLRTTRTELAAMVRDVVEQRADPDMPRMFAAGDFAVPDS